MWVHKKSSSQSQDLEQSHGLSVVNHKKDKDQFKHCFLNDWWKLEAFLMFSLHNLMYTFPYHFPYTRHSPFLTVVLYPEGKVSQGQTCVITNTALIRLNHLLSISYPSKGSCRSCFLPNENWVQSKHGVIWCNMLTQLDHYDGSMLLYFPAFLIRQLPHAPHCQGGIWNEANVNCLEI